MESIGKELKLLRQTVLDPLATELEKMLSKKVALNVDEDMVENETKEGLAALGRQAFEAVTALEVIRQKSPALVGMMAKNLESIEILPGKTRKVAYTGDVLYFTINTKVPDPEMSSVLDVLHALEHPGVH